MGSEKEGFQTTQRPPQEVSRRPRTLQGLEVGANLAPKRGPKIDPKSIKIRAWEPPRPKTPPGVPPGRKMTPKSKKKRLILTPEICKKRPASRFVFQRCWEGKSEAQYQKRASIPSFFFVRMQCNAMQYNTLQYNAMQCNAMAQPNARKNAMSCSVPCIRCPRALAMPSSPIF